MRVLILTPSAILYGGVERIIEALNDGLPARGIDVVVGLAKGGLFHDPERYRRAYPTLRSIELDATTGTSEGRRRAIDGVLDRLKPDVVLIARLSSALDVIAERKLRGDALRAVFAVRAYEPNYFIDLARFGPFLDYCVVDGRLCLEAASEVCGFPAERTRSIPGGVPPAAAGVERRGGSPLRIGYVGRLERDQKRILDLPEILKLLSARKLDFSCVIAGEGPAEAELRERTRSAGLGDRVRFAGACDSERLYREIYPNIEIFLHCAAWEGVTMAPREAMAHGAVPVVSRFRGLASEGMFLDGVNARTFPVGDVERAASIVAELAGDSEQWRRLSVAARSSQQGIRSHEGALDAWAECFRRVRELSPRRGAAVPRVPRPAEGRLDRLFGFGPAETIRRVLRLRYRHEEPGGEWPHWTGVDDPELRRRVEEFAVRAEAVPSASAAIR
jgi:glycosyltransferase involved in cell wall biosynthesis